MMNRIRPEKEVADQHRILTRKLKGHDAYYGITHNGASLERLSSAERTPDGAAGAWICKWAGGVVVVKMEDDVGQIQFADHFINNVMGVRTPRSLSVPTKSKEGQMILDAIAKHRDSNDDEGHAITFDQLRERANVLIMDHVDATPFNIAEQEQVGDAVLAPGVPEALGRLIMADTFLNNPDRVRPEPDPRSMASYVNPQNLMVGNQAHELVAIDNSSNLGGQTGYLETYLTKLLSADNTIISGLLQQLFQSSQISGPLIDYLSSNSHYVERVRAGLHEGFNLLLSYSAKNRDLEGDEQARAIARTAQRILTFAKEKNKKK